ncbi:MAG: phosphopantothenoylcysteine decarboxylase [Patescibacteria group bacterium]
MKILVTAGSTQVPIDKVRAITNIFKGRTGAAIARWLDSLNDYRGSPKMSHEIVLLTSTPEMFLDGKEILSYEKYLTKKAEYREQCRHGFQSAHEEEFGLLIVRFRTFDDLARIMEQEIRTGGYDVVIHSAAVSDYEVAGVLRQGSLGNLEPIDFEAKVSSKHPELYLRLVPTFKIVDRIKKEWGFKGKLVKFKLEVGKSDEELIEIAKKSGVASDADLIVANCLEWARERAYIIDWDGVINVTREKLPKELALRLGIIGSDFVPLPPVDGSRRRY